MSDGFFGISAEYLHAMSIFFQIGYSLGLFGAFIVVLTGLLFWNSMVRSKIYMKLLMAMSVCDFGASITGVFGFGESVSVGVCKAQGVMWYLFNRASWMFTVCITVTLFTQVMYNKIYIQFKWMAAIVASISIILLILPLTLTDYMKYGGALSTVIGTGNCCSFMVGQLHDSRTTTGHITAASVASFYTWYIAMCMVPFFACAAVTLVLVAYIRIAVYPRMANAEPQLASRVMQCSQSVLWYPLIMAVFWAPNFLWWFGTSDFEARSLQYQRRAFLGQLGTFAWTTLYPLGIAIYFFYRSAEARMRWRNLLGLNAYAAPSDLPVDDGDADSVANASPLEEALNPAFSFSTMASTIYSSSASASAPASAPAPASASASGGGKGGPRAPYSYAEPGDLI